MIVGAGNAFTVPLADTFCVVAPVDEQATFPEGVPEADAVNLTNMVVAFTVPEDGANETESTYPLPDTSET